MDNKLTLQFPDVMIIDDSKMDTALLKGLLLRLGIARTLTVYNCPVKAFEHIKMKESPHPHLIFLDLNMPELNGFEFLDELYQLPGQIAQKIKVIIVTSSDATEDIIKSSEYDNVINYLLKPVNIMNLEEVFLQGMKLVSE